MGKLYIVSTPIGNLEDITLRAIRVLKEADHILCEDTRVSKKLLDHYEIETPTISYRDQNHQRLLPEILSLLAGGSDLALISDAGTPAISDPGFKLIKQLIEEGIDVEVVPGPSSVISALVISGFPTDKFTFLGFLPKSSGKQEKMLQNYLDMDASIIIFESPFRVVKLLESLEKNYTDRYVAVINDQTNMYEQVWRGLPGDLLELLSEIPKLKGEFIVVIAKKGFSLGN